MPKTLNHQFMLKGMFFNGCCLWNSFVVMPIAITLLAVMADPFLSGAWGEELSYFFPCCPGSTTNKMQLSGVSWENSLNDSYGTRMKGKNCIRNAALWNLRAALIQCMSVLTLFKSVLTRNGPDAKDRIPTKLILLSMGIWTTNLCWCGTWGVSRRCALFYFCQNWPGLANIAKSITT